MIDLSNIGRPDRTGKAHEASPISEPAQDSEPSSVEFFICL
jgi:hypothetical protein